ncbi:hypothetical protein [Streptomyces radicis]|nr:hypothetical protein [Streptomyces radicis]
MLGLPLIVEVYDSDELGREAGRLLLDRVRSAPGAGAQPRRAAR